MPKTHESGEADEQGRREGAEQLGERRAVLQQWLRAHEEHLEL